MHSNAWKSELGNYQSEYPTSELSGTQHKYHLLHFNGALAKLKCQRTHQISFSHVWFLSFKVFLIILMHVHFYSTFKGKGGARERGETCSKALQPGVSPRAAAWSCRLYQVSYTTPRDCILLGDVGYVI